MENIKTAPPAENQTAEMQANVQVKTPEELALQLNVINLERHMQQQEPLPSTAVLSDDPQHKEYVGSLRQLRKSQTAFLEERKYVMQDGNSSTGRQFGEFWRSRNFSPLGWAALANINSPQGYDTYLTTSQRQAAVQSVEMINSMVDVVVERASSTIYSSLPDFEAIWGKQKTLERVERELETYPGSALFHVDEIVGHFGPAKGCTLIQGSVDHVIKSGINSGGSIYTLANPEQRALLKPEQVEPLVALTLSDITSFEAGREYGRDELTSNVLKLKKAGLVHDQQITDAIIKILEQEDHLTSWSMSEHTFSSSLGLYETMLDAAELKGRAKELLADRIKKGQLIGEISEMALFNEEEKRGLLIHAAESKPDLVLGRDIENVISLLGKKETKDLFLKKAGNLNLDKLCYIFARAPEDFLTSAEKESLLSPILEQDPGKIFFITSMIVEVFGQKKAQNMVRQAYNEGLLDTEGHDAHKAIAAWLPFISDDPDELKQIFIEQLHKQEEITVLSNYYVPQLELKDMFTEEEIASLVESRLTDPQCPLPYDPYVIEIEAKAIVKMFDTEKVLDLTKKTIQTKPEIAAALLSQSFHLIDKDELVELTRQIIELEPTALLQKPVLVIHALGAEAINDVLDRAIALNPQQCVYRVKDLYYQGHLTETAYNKYVGELISINPAFVCMMGGFGVNDKNLINVMQNQTEIGRIAPKWLKKYIDEYQKSTLSSRSILISEAMVLFNNLHAIRQKSPQLLENIDQLAGNASSQASAIAKLAFLAKSGLLDTEEQALNIEDQHKLDDLVYTGLEKMLGIELTGAARQQSKAGLDSIITYLAGIDKSEAHYEIIAGLLSCSSSDELRDFRLMAGNEQALAEAKSLGLLPSNLTPQQHSLWREDLVVDRQESLKASTQEVIDAVKDIVLANEEHFELDRSANLSEHDGQQLNDEVKDLGSRLAELHRILGDKTQSEELIEETKGLADKVRGELSMRQTLLLLSDLYTLTDDEIINGGKLASNGQKATSIDNILEKVLKLSKQRELGEGARLAIVQIGSIFNSFNEQTEEDKDLSIVDTIDLKTTIEVGAKPVGSCQHFATGMFRSALLGYTDPNTKIITIRDGETIIARSVLRLLEDEDGKPALHVERIYSQSPSHKITEGIYELAFEKAKTIGVPVYISRTSSTADDQSQTDSQFRYAESPVILSAKSIRAPVVYVDAAGGSKKAGYQIQNVSQIVRS